ncbi:MAG: M23 family metallopeptidase [Rickettsiales bacterium]|jgi:murein DD-endopeptidase MepM/ murein hydrolase activator NlpD
MYGYPTSYSTYPIKIACRTTSISRLQKMRFSWFFVGVAFSLGCTSALTPLFGNAESISISRESTLEDIIGADSNESISLENIISASPEELPDLTLYTDNIDNSEDNSDSSPEIATNHQKEHELKVKEGDNVIQLLTDAGVSIKEAENTLGALRTVFNPRKLDINTVINLQTDKDDTGDTIVSELSIPVSTLSSIKLNRTQDNSFDAKKMNMPTTKKLARAGGTIDNSIYQTGADSGIPPAMLNELINAYSYDVDFQRDVKKGDAIDVLFERMETSDGTIADTGNFVFSELTLGKKILKIYRYTDKDGIADFYNEDGESIRKAMLRTPINGARITSKYGKRLHPIAGYTKMHRGVDFGAASGTPIYAAGDGIVKRASRNGGYGNYLKIQHNQKYASAYAHLSRYAKEISPGKHVKQGQIIGYVGTTGSSTGPHLHYEILVNNMQVNPANVKFKTGTVLKGRELVAFRENMTKIEARLASLGRGNTIAMVEKSNKKTTN